MKNKIVFILSVICLLIIPTRTYGMTENAVGYITKGEINKVSSSQIVIGNVYGDLQPGEYFTINLIGAEFDVDDNGNPKIDSYNVEFEQRNKSSVYGKLLDNVEGWEDVSIRFSSKILANEAKIEVDGEDSHITSGTYTYATTPDSEISYKGKIEIEKARLFDHTYDLGPILIKESNNGAFRSAMIYEYNVPELIKIEVPKGVYEFYGIDYSNPITIVVDDGNGNEMQYKLGENEEVDISSERNILTFKQYTKDILQSIPRRYTIRIENVRLKATKSNQEKDVYMTLGGQLLEEQEILVAKQIKNESVFETFIKEIVPGKEQRVTFVIQEGKGNTFLTTKELSFGLTNGTKINFKDDFKLKLVDGLTTYDQNQSRFEIEENDYSFTILNFSRENKDNLIRIEGEFTVRIPDKVEDDIRFFVSDPGVPGVLYSTIFEGNGDNQKSKVFFTINKDMYKIGEETFRIDAKPYMSAHNRIMVPFRYVAYALGVGVEDLKWDGLSKTISLQGERPMMISAETGEMIIDGESIVLSEINLTGGRTFVPVGEIAKAFGTEVKWDASSKTAIFN